MMPVGSNVPVKTWHYRLAQVLAGATMVVLGLCFCFGVGVYAGLIARVVYLGWRLGWSLW